MSITDAQHGSELVVETRDKIFIGRYEGEMCDTVLLKEAMEHAIEEGQEREDLIRELAESGFPREEDFRAVAALEILRIRRLEEVLAD